MLTNQARLSLLVKGLGSNLSGIVPLIRGYNLINYKCMIHPKNIGERTIMKHTYRPAGSFAGQSPRSRANNAIELNAVKRFRDMRYATYMFCLGAALAAGQAHAQSGQLLYVSNRNSNSVSVYQTNADGSLTAVTTIAAIGTQPRGVAVRGDQAFAYVALNGAGVHALTLSAHKLGGPKGAGALVVDKRVELQPLIAGGGHERGLRSGTENVAAIVGFGLAAELAVARLDARAQQLAALRAELEAGLVAQGATIFAGAAERLPNTSYFAFAGIDGETLVGKLDRAGFAVAAGAACSSANPEPSHVLLAMGVESRLARGAVRVSLGTDNTASQVRDLLGALNTTILQLKGLQALTS